MYVEGIQLMRVEIFSLYDIILLSDAVIEISLRHFIAKEEVDTAFQAKLCWAIIKSMIAATRVLPFVKCPASTYCLSSCCYSSMANK